MALNYRLVLLLTLTLAPAGWAQDSMRMMFNPELGKTPVSVSGGYSYAPGQEVSGQDADLSISRYETGVLLPLGQNQREEWLFTANHATTRFNTGAVLPDSGRPLPEAFYEPSLGLGYRHRLDNDWIWGGFFSLGSASDKPFDTWDEYAVDLTASLQTPLEEGRAWLFFLNVSANREFAPGVPLPGLAYFWQPNEQFSSILGLPFAMVFWNPVQPVRIEASWFPLHTIDTTISYSLSETTALYTGFYWDSDLFQMSGREEDEDRLVWYRKEVRLGLRHEFTKALGVNTYAGYQFDRFLFEGEDWGDRGDNRIDMADGPMVAMNAYWKF